MFGFFKKPVGVHIRDNAIVAVKLAKAGKIPELERVVRIALPGGVVADGSILDEAVLAEKMRELAGQVDLQDCNFALPASKCFSSVLKFPAGMSDDVIERSLPEKIISVVPANLENLYWEYKILRGDANSEILVVIAGVEKTEIQSYLKLFKSIGVDDPGYVLDSVAAFKAISLYLTGQQAFIFAHAFEDKALLNAVYDGALFDSICTREVQTHFAEVYTAYYQQIGVAPAQVVLSGAPALRGEFSKVQFSTAAPQFVEVEFLVNFDNSNRVQHDLIVATGLALLGRSAGKKDGNKLVNLLD